MIIEFIEREDTLTARELSDAENEIIVEIVEEEVESETDDLENQLQTVTEETEISKINYGNIDENNKEYSKKFSHPFLNDYIFI